MNGESLPVPSPENEQGQAGFHCAQRGHVHLASPRDLLWAGPEQHQGEMGNRQTESPNQGNGSQVQGVVAFVSMLLSNSEIFLLLFNVDCLHSSAIF